MLDVLTGAISSSEPREIGNGPGRRNNMSERTTVFVCATYMDLSEERGAVLDAIQRLQLQFDSMEFFGARPEQPLETCLAEVGKSDIVVVIVGQKYGSILPKQAISYSEAEYREARRLGLPCLVYIRADASAPDIEETSRKEALQRWKTVLSERHTVYNFKNSSDLALQVTADLSREVPRSQIKKTNAAARSQKRDGSGSSLANAASSVPRLRFAQKFGDAARQLLYCLAIDKRENIVIGGSFWGGIDFGPNQFTNSLDRSVFIAKFDNEGRHLWSCKSGGAGEHVAAGIATDDSDAIYIVTAFKGTIDFGGPTFSSKGRYNVAIAKLNSSGEHVWSRAFGQEGYYVPEGLAVTPDGRIIVAGRFTGSIDFGGGEIKCESSQTDIFLYSAFPNGEYRWAKRIGGPYEQQTRSIAINSDGAIAISGLFKGSIKFDNQELVEDRPNEYCGFLSKFSDNGQVVWCKRVGEPFAEQGSEVTFDSQSGDIVASGLIRNKLPAGTNSGSESRCLLARYDRLGILQWSKTFQSASIESISIGQRGRILVAGNFRNNMNVGTGLMVSAGGLDIFAALFEADGTPIWAQRYGDERHQFLVKGVHSPSGLIILAGSFHGTIDFGGRLLVASGYDGRSEGAEDIFLAILQ